MKIEMWEIGRVKPYEHNPRKNEGAVEAVAKKKLRGEPMHGKPFPVEAEDRVIDDLVGGLEVEEPAEEDVGAHPWLHPRPAPWAPPRHDDA